MRQTRFIQTASLVLVLALSVVSQGAVQHRIGRASGSLGSATIDGQKIAIGSAVFEGSRIVTGATDSASVLLDSNVVIKFDANTSATLTETNGTHVVLQKGNVEIFMSKRGPIQGAVALSDPDANIEALGTVFIASYTPATRDGWYATVESTRPRGISVKGNADNAASDIVPGKHAMLHAGKLQNIADNTAADLKTRKGKIVDLDGLSNTQAGTFLRQQTALATAVKLSAPAGFRLTNAEAGEIRDENSDRAIVDSRQWQTVNDLVRGGIISSTGGSGITGGPSSGGFTDTTVTLDTGNFLSFRLLDTGVQDGDQVSLKITENGNTVASIPLVTLTNTGQVFTEKVGKGTVNISLTAINEGALPPNTGGVNFLSAVQTGKSSQAYAITTGQTATLRVKTK